MYEISEHVPTYVAVMQMDDLPKRLHTFADVEEMLAHMAQYNEGKLHCDIGVTYFEDDKEIVPVFDNESNVIGTELA